MQTIGEIARGAVTAPKMIKRNRPKKTHPGPAPTLESLLATAATVGSDEPAIRTMLADTLAAQISRSDWNKVISALTKSSHLPATTLRAWAKQMGGAAAIEAPVASVRVLADAAKMSQVEAKGMRAEPEGTAAPAGDLLGGTEDLSVPMGFRRDAEGWWFIKPTGSGEHPVPPRWICAPFKVLGEARNEHGTGWGLVVAFNNRDGEARRVILRRVTLHGDTAPAIAPLVDAGLRLSSLDDTGKLLLRLLRGIQATGRVREVSRVGWLDAGGYLLPDGKAIGAGEAVVLSSDRIKPTLAAALTSRSGTLEGWRQYVAVPALCSSRATLSVCTAFAGPLLHLVGGEGGGVHIVGGSKIGKTTAARVGGSVWGKPDKDGLLLSWRATDNNLETTAFAHNDRTAFLDEVGQADPRIVGKTAYMLPNGRGRGRMDRDGSARETLTWALDFVSTGEVSIAAVIEQSAPGAKVQAGQAVRLIDLPADVGRGLGVYESLPNRTTGAEMSDRLIDAALEHYGHAGRAFIERLVEEVQRGRDAYIATLRERVVKTAATMLPQEASGQTQTVARRLARYAIAGELATEWGITGWQRGDATSRVTRCFRDWLGVRLGGAGDHEAAAARHAVRAFLQAHGTTRFAPLSDVSIAASDFAEPPPGAEAPPNAAPRNEEESVGVMLDVDGRVYGKRAGFYWDTIAGRGFYVFPATMRSEVLAGMDWQTACRSLVEAGVIVRSSSHFTQKVRIPGARAPSRMFVVPPGAWAGADEEVDDPIG